MSVDLLVTLLILSVVVLWAGRRLRRLWRRDGPVAGCNGVCGAGCSAGGPPAAADSGPMDLSAACERESSDQS